MIDLARDYPGIRSQEELNHLLGRKLRYTVVFRLHLELGISDIPFTHRLGDDSPSFEYTRDVLETLAGRPPAMFVNARIVVIEERSGEDPLDLGSTFSLEPTDALPPP